MSLSHEISIVGCGPVGLLLANFLVKSNYISSIALIDRKLPFLTQNPSSIPNQRVYSINKFNLNILQQLSLKDNIRGYGKMSNIHVVSKQSQQQIFWSNNTAQVIENDQIIRVLSQNLHKNYPKKIQFIQAQLTSISNQNKKSQIKLSNGNKIYSKLLVGSDGNQSKVKQLSRIATYGWSHRQKAIVCTLQLEDQFFKQDQQICNQNAYQIYYQGNVLAVLPLWKNYVSIVWSLKYPQMEYLMGLNDEKFLKSLNQVLKNGGQYSKYRFPQLKSISNKRLAFPLNSLQADRYIKQRIALIGDAAHSIHPMAGMGVNSGFYDALFLANNIIKNKKTGNDIGNQIALNNFEVESKKLNYANSIAMQGIKKAFQIDFTPFNYLRKKGMQAVGNDFLKNEIKRAAQSHPFGQIKQFEWQTN